MLFKLCCPTGQVFGVRTCAFAAASVVTCGNHKRVLVDVLFDFKMNLPNMICIRLTDNGSFLGRHGR